MGGAHVLVVDGEAEEDAAQAQVAGADERRCPQSEPQADAVVLPRHRHSQSQPQTQSQSRAVNATVTSDP